MWQDITITLISVLFSFALVPQIILGFRKKKRTIALPTGILTTLGLFTLAFVYFTLRLYISTVTQSALGILWFILIIQLLIYKE